MFKKLLIILSVFTLTQSLFAETSPQQDRVPKDPSVPPTQGVIHIPDTINPSEEYPILGKENQRNSKVTKPKSVERPVIYDLIQPGGLFGLFINQITIPGVGTGKDMEEGGDISKITIEGVGTGKNSGEEGVDISKTKWDEYTDGNLPPGQDDPPKRNIELLRELSATFKGEPDLQMHVVRLSAATLAISTAIIASKALLGKKLKVLAAVAPPEVVTGVSEGVMDAMGRSGYRVPTHSEYSEEDVRDLALYADGLSDQELEKLQAELDPKFLNYAEIVGAYIRQGRAIEHLEACPNPDLCS